MSHIYVVLQVITSLYCIDLMLQVDKGEFWSFFIIGVHLIIYLLGAINKKVRIKKKIYTLDMVWIVGSMLLSWIGVGIVAVLLCAEYALLDEQKKELGVFIGLASIANLMSIEEIKWMWGWYLIIGVLGWFIYKNEKRILYLTSYNQTLKEESIKLQQKIEEIAKEKSQIEYLTKVNERNLLAQRLHDKIGHTLAGNIMQLEVVKLIFKQDADKAIQMLNQITNQLRVGMDDIRLTLRELKPEQSEVGIQQIKSILKDVESRHEIKTYLNYEGDLENIGINRWKIIEDNLQEVVTNFLKYSEGDQMSVSIQNLNQVIRVSFEDNGKVQGPIKKGLGIKGIEERMVMNNGRMVLNTDKGFQIILIFNK